MLKKFATIPQVERAVEYINVKETDREGTLRYVDLYEAKVLHFRHYARLEIRIVYPFYVST